MVMGTIEDFADGIDEIVVQQQHCDSLCAWLLSVPVDELELMPKETLQNLVFDAVSNSFVSFDKAAEHMRFTNKQNMSVIGISEKELKEFMEEYHKEIVIEEQAPVSDDFYTPNLRTEDLYTLEVYKKQFDSLKALN